VVSLLFDSPRYRARRLSGPATNMALIWLIVRSAFPQCRGPGGPQRPQRLNEPVATLRHRGGPPGQDRFGGGVGVEDVGLPAGPPVETVGPVDLPNVIAGLGQSPGDAGAVAAGAFHPHQDDPRPPGQEPDHLAVAASGGFDPHVVDRATVRVDDRDVVAVGMRVDPGVHQLRPARPSRPRTLLATLLPSMLLSHH
jgi:hypothetical protein